MPQKKQVMYFGGLTISSVCMKCGYLNLSFTEKYRCCCKGYCPHYLTQEQKEYIISNWNPIEITVSTFEEDLDAGLHNMVKDMGKMEDERILKLMTMKFNIKEN